MALLQLILNISSYSPQSDIVLNMLYWYESCNLLEPSSSCSSYQMIAKLVEISSQTLQSEPSVIAIVPCSRVQASYFD